MFFVVDREDVVVVEPKYFGMNMGEHLMRVLKEKVEGRPSGKYGLTILVYTLTSMGHGRLVETGEAHFTVSYRALVFRPFRNEVLPAVVLNVSELGFFAQAGPCKIFVSNHLMPGDLRFDNTDSPCFVSEDEEVRIEPGTLVRVKVAGIRHGHDELSLVGRIDEDYLGVLGPAVEDGWGGAVEPSAQPSAIMESDR